MAATGCYGTELIRSESFGKVIILMQCDNEELHNDL
jgi:hypothetical protein